MAVNMQEFNEGRLLELQISGRLAHADYAAFLPRFEERVRQHGRIRLLMEMVDFHGWEPAALWDELKLDVKHFADFERVAMVGEARWEKFMSLFCRPFTSAEVRYFDRSEIAAAREWVRGA